jgi:hypothetical protein
VSEDRLIRIENLLYSMKSDHTHTHTLLETHIKNFDEEREEQKEKNKEVNDRVGSLEALGGKIVAIASFVSAVIGTCFSVAIEYFKT